MTLGLYRNCSTEDDHVLGRRFGGSSFNRAVRWKPMVRQIRGAMGFQCSRWAGIAALTATESATVLNFTSPNNTGNFSKANTYGLCKQRDAHSLPRHEEFSQPVEAP